MAENWKVVGEKLIGGKLDMFTDGVTKRATVAALNAGLTPLKNAIIASLPGSMKDMRRSVTRSRTLKLKQTGRFSGIRTGGVGFGVGISKAKRRQMGADAAAKRAKHNEQAASPRSKKRHKAGVGISLNNFYWWLFGTKPRFQGHRSMNSTVHTSASKTSAILSVARKAGGFTGGKNKRAKFKDNVQRRYTGMMPIQGRPVPEGAMKARAAVNAAIKAKMKERVIAEVMKLQVKGIQV